MRRYFPTSVWSLFFICSVLLHEADLVVQHTNRQEYTGNGFIEKEADFEENVPIKKSKVKQQFGINTKPTIHTDNKEPTLEVKPVSQWHPIQHPSTKHLATQHKATQHLATQRSPIFLSNDTVHSLRGKSVDSLPAGDVNLKAGASSLDIKADPKTNQTEARKQVAKKEKVPKFKHLATEHKAIQQLATQNLDTQQLATQHKDTQHQDTQQLATQHKATQQLATQHLDTQHLDTQQLATQHLDTQHLATQHKANQHLDTQHKANQHLDTQHLDNQHLATQRSPIVLSNGTVHSLRGKSVDSLPAGDVNLKAGASSLDIKADSKTNQTEARRQVAKKEKVPKFNFTDPQSRSTWLRSKSYFAIDGNPPTKYSMLPSVGKPWPMPFSYHSTDDAYLLDLNSLQFTATKHSCHILDFSIKRLRINLMGQSLFGANKPPAWSNQTYPVLHGVHIHVVNPCAKYPSLESIESYNLVVSATNVTIRAKEVWGALRALETLSQIVYETGYDNLFYVNRTEVTDEPRFPHRGVLVDTARHFITKENIILNLEAMAQNKMNVFHWHIVDDQSFPFQSRTFPDLSNKGAYDPVTHVYTPSDVAEVIEEARLRGIRVIPEFDTPGHALSWGNSMSTILTPCMSNARKWGPLNPARNSTYTILGRLYSEVVSVFQDRYVHIGGDEVSTDCWSSNEEIKEFVRRAKLPSFGDLFNYFIAKLLRILDDISRTLSRPISAIVWQEVFDRSTKIHDDTIVQVWQGNSNLIRSITSKGYRSIFSTCWYLDNLNSRVDWHLFYLCDNALPISNSLFLGGETCMWSEYVDNTNILSRIWPRSSAAAERLWSQHTVNSIQEAAPRLEEQRCRMQRRGIPTGVASGPGSCAQSSFINPIHYRSVNLKTPLRKTFKSDMQRSNMSELVILRLLQSDDVRSSENATDHNQSVFSLDISRHTVLLVAVVVMVVLVLSCFYSGSSVQFRKSRSAFPECLTGNRGSFRKLNVLVIFIFIYVTLMLHYTNYGKVTVKLK